jgi:hypothetical protein
MMANLQFLADQGTEEWNVAGMRLKGNFLLHIERFLHHRHGLLKNNTPLLGDGCFSH